MTLAKIPPKATKWLNDQLKEAYTLTPLAGDASFRQYFRCFIKEKSYIFSYEPKKNNQVEKTAASLQYFANNNLPTPSLYAHSIAKGLTLQQDLGTNTLWHLKNHDIFFKYAIKSIDFIHRLIKAPINDLIPFDQDYMLKECQLLIQWLLPLTNTHWHTQEIAAYQKICQTISSYLAKSATVPIHRDFHSRNIMIQNDDLFIIDVQDIMQGHCLYDLVSLLKDCYIKWPLDLINKQLLCFFKKQPQLFNDWQHCQKSFDFISIQRHLKVIGIFARLATRDQKPAFLQYINPTIKEIITTAKKHEELELLIPLINKIKI